MGKHNNKKGPTERLVKFVGVSGDATSALHCRTLRKIETLLTIDE